MKRRGLVILAWGLLSVGLGLVPARDVRAEEISRYYYYPYIYYPHNYAPNYEKWPDPRVPFQMPPTYMSYPKVRDGFYRYDILENRRYHRGFHFFLDQF